MDRVAIDQVEVDVITDDTNTSSSATTTVAMTTYDTTGAAVTKTTAIERHIMRRNHRINWIDTRILWDDNDPYKLLIKESISIKKHESALNRTTHSVPLYIYPNGLEE